MIKYALLLLSALVLAGCNVDDASSYRYPCQDPENVKKKECNPPVCELDGTCTKYLIDEKTLKSLKTSK